MVVERFGVEVLGADLAVVAGGVPQEGHGDHQEEGEGERSEEEWPSEGGDPAGRATPRWGEVRGVRRGWCSSVADSPDAGWGRVYGAPMTTTMTEMRDAPARRLSHRRVALVVVLLLLLVGVSAAAWWVTHPRAFLGVGNVATGPVPVGTHAYVGMEVIPSDGMVLHGATPRVVFSTGDVETEVLVCRLAGPTGVGFVHEGDIESLCESLRTPDGPVEEGDYLVVQVVADTSGLVAMNGIDLTYSSGLQRGTQAVGPEAAVIVEDP